MRATLTIKQCAAVLAEDVHTTLARIHDGSLPAINTGRGKLRPRWRIAEESLQAFINSRASQPVRRPTRQQKIKRDWKEFV